MADASQTVRIPPEELERLVERFGNQVRQMGRWNVSGDGSLEVPVRAIREAASELGNDSLTAAVNELKAEHFTRMLEAPHAAALIDKVASAYKRQFRETMSAYQSTNDADDTDRLRDQLVREIFGA